MWLANQTGIGGLALCPPARRSGDCQCWRLLTIYVGEQAPILFTSSYSPERFDCTKVLVWIFPPARQCRHDQNAGWCASFFAGLGGKEVQRTRGVHCNPKEGHFDWLDGKFGGTN